MTDKVNGTEGEEKYSETGRRRSGRGEKEGREETERDDRDRRRERTKRHK